MQEIIGSWLGFYAVSPASGGGRGGGGRGEPKKVTTFQRLRHQEFSSGDSTGGFGLRSFRRPELYCEGTAPSFI